ncbi:MAG: hypothetical protein GY719_19745 [bacterium]|nr:hypothetical protein [bacterium]
MTRDQSLVPDSSSKIVPPGPTRVVPQPHRKRALLVVGMHRSGTSATTRVLNLLGSDLPARLMPARPGDNPLGYWESPELADLHDELLESAGSAWDDVSSLPESWHESEAGAGYLQRVSRILESNFDDSVLFVIKDPRLGRLLPLWLRALERFGAEPGFVLPVRNPLEVAASLKVRGGFQLAKSLLLWLSHVLETERRTRGFRRSVLAYEDLLQDWRGVVDDIARDLELKWPRLSHQATAEISAFLSEKYRHHHADGGELQARSDVTPWVKEAYDAVLELRTSNDPAITDRLDRIWRELQTADGAFGPVIAESQLNLAARGDRVVELESEVSSRQAEVDRLGGELTTLGGRITELESELSARQSEVDRLSEGPTVRDGRIADLEDETQAGSRERERLSGELSSSRAEAERFGSELEDERKRIDWLSRELSAHGRERERLVAELSAGEGESVHLREELASSRRELALARDQVQLLESEAEAVRRRMDVRGQELADSRSEVTRLHGELEDRRNETAHMTVVAKERLRQLVAIREESQRLRMCLEVARAETESLDLRLGKARSELDYMTDCRSWRLTRPLRWLLGHWQRRDR